ncbi:MAG: DNA methyltransferase [Candidatus Pacebacteria bacterium]|nr:DNA methyltransferase [Candidatus Paceibacterota bacterium]
MLTELRRTIFCRDNLEVLRVMASESVDLVYLDPPFNKNQNFHAPIGSQAEGASFKDIWGEEDLKAEWLGLIADQQPAIYAVLNGVREAGNRSDFAYLAYMAIRLIEVKRVMKPTASLFLHCDDTMSDYLKILLDVIFGRANFRNQIIWKRITGSKNQAASFGRVHDIILLYSKSDSFIYKKIHLDKNPDYMAKTYTKNDGDGRGNYRHHELVAARSQRMGGRREFEFKGVIAPWLYSEEKLQAMWDEGRIVKTPSGYRRKIYESESKGGIVSDLWVDELVRPIIGNAKESVNYPTQKPLALLDRIIRSSTEVGDTVLDPFCGCATTCVAAERLDRNWIGIDISPKAYVLVRDRLQRELEDRGDLSFRIDSILFRTDLPTSELVAIPADRSTRHRLYGEQQGHCKGCAVHFEFRHLTLDHIVPRAKGGGEEEQNLQLLCGSCNSIKGDRPMDYLMLQLRERKIIS